MSLKAMTTEDVYNLIHSRQVHQPGDYINPCVIGERLVLKVVDRMSCPWGVFYMAKDSHGHVMEVYVSDDPRKADEEQIKEFNTEEAAYGNY